LPSIKKVEIVEELVEMEPPPPDERIIETIY